MFKFEYDYMRLIAVGFVCVVVITLSVVWTCHIRIIKYIEAGYTQAMLPGSCCSRWVKDQKGEVMTKMLQEDWEKEYSYAGHFQTALMRTIECADHINLAKLEKEYPDIGKEFKDIDGFPDHIPMERIDNV